MSEQEAEVKTEVKTEAQSEGKGFKITVIANIVGIIVGGLSIVSAINNHIEDITKTQTETIAVFFAKDIRTRLRLFETYVDELEAKGEKAPILILYNIKELKGQLLELETWQEHEHEH